MTHLVLYDGVCGLCDHFVQFLLRVDRTDQLRFAALQGPIGTELMRRHGREADVLSTVVVIPDYERPSPRLLDRSDAALFAMAATGGVFRAVNLFKIVPRVLRDAMYRVIARTRYRIFGKFDACPIPSPRTRAKFLDFPGGSLAR